MNCKQTQGRKLIALLKRRSMTTMDMLRTEISVSPWRRISESLKPCERLEKVKNKRGLFVYRVRG